MTRILRKSASLLLAALLLASPGRAGVILLKFSTSPIGGPQFRQIVANQLGHFLTLSPTAGFKYLQNLAGGPSLAGTELVADQKAAAALLTLLATPRYAPDLRAQMVETLGPANTDAITTLSKRLRLDARADDGLEKTLTALQKSFAPSQGSLEAKAALDELFDASGNVASTGLVLAGEEQAHPSGLKKPEAVTPADIFKAAHPQSTLFDFLQREGKDFNELAVSAMVADTFYSERRSALTSLLEEDSSRDQRSYLEALKEVLEFADTADRDEAARRFVVALARADARGDITFPMAEWLAGVTNNKAARPPNYDLPANPLKAGEFWDLAAGMNAGFFLRKLEAGTKYKFFDKSLYVVEYLRELQRIAIEKGVPHAENAEIVLQDLNTLVKPDGGLAGLRWKNVHTYVKGFETRLPEMAGWINEGGQLVVENDPMPVQIDAMIRKIGPHLQSLIVEGWSFRYRLYGERGETHNPDLESLIFTRPAEGKILPTKALWEDYLSGKRGKW